MPTVPRTEPEEEDFRSLISGGKGMYRDVFPDEYRTYGGFTMTKEQAKATMEAEGGEPDVGSKLPIKSKEWNRFLEEGPKSTRIETRPPMSQEAVRQYGLNKLKAAYRGEDIGGYEDPKIMRTKYKPPSWGNVNLKDTATKSLGLNQQEQYLYQHHLDNLAKGGVPNSRGTSTILAHTVGFGKKTYIIPSVWNNQIVSLDQAINNAKREGLDKFPSYSNRTQATNRYIDMHKYMDMDVGPPEAKGVEGR